MLFRSSIAHIVTGNKPRFPDVSKSAECATASNTANSGFLARLNRDEISAAANVATLTETEKASDDNEKSNATEKAINVGITTTAGIPQYSKAAEYPAPHGRRPENSAAHIDATDTTTNMYFNTARFIKRKTRPCL